MKKLLCSHLSGFITLNRFVYQVSDEEKGGMRAAMEAATADTKTELFDDNQKLDKAKISKDFAGKIDTYIKSKTAEIKRVETDPEKKAAQEKKEKDYADALAALREEYVGKDGNGGKLAELMGQADKKREESAKSFSESMGVKLTEENRKNVDGAFAKGTELYKHYDEIDSGSNGPGAQMPVILNMLKVVYIEEGKDAALRLAQDMEKRSEGVGNNMDTKNMNEVFGEATFKTANDLELTKGASADLQGRMYGLVYLSGRAFGDSETGKQAQAAYLQFLKAEAARIGQIKDYNEKNKAAQALITPTEWASTNPEYKGGLKKYAEVSEKGSKIFELTDKIPNPMERNMMNGILRGIIAGETDPRKQEELINSALAAMGKTVADIGSITSADIQKFTKDKKLDGYGDGMWKLPNNIDIRFEMQGRLSGLMHVADSTDFGKDEFGNDRNPRVRAAYKSYIAEVTAENSPLMKDVLAKAKDLGDLTKAMTDARDSKDLAKFVALNAQMGQKITEVLTPFYAGVKKPTEWLADFDAKEKKEGAANPDQKYVDNVLSSIPRGNNPFEYDHLAGILLAVIKGQPKEKWGELVNARLADMKIDPKNITEADRAKFMNVVGGRTAYNKNWTVDAKSKGYVSSMIFSADKVGGTEDPEFVTRYRTYVQAQMNKLDSDPEFKDAVDGRDKAGMGLKSRLETAVAKLNADPNPSNKAEVASIQSQMDQIEAGMFKKTQELVMDPVAYKAQEKKETNDKFLGENKDFLDKNSNLDAAGAKKAFDAIFAPVDVTKMDAAKKKAFEAKKAELAGPKGLAGAKTGMDRMRVIAQAQDYVNSLTDPNAANRYQDVAFNYDLTSRTLVLSKLDIAKKEKNYKDFLESYAVALGLPKDSKDVSDALAEIKKEQDPDKRAAVIADQLTKITAASTAIPNNPKTSPFTKADFEIYSAYIADQQKKNQAPPGGPGGTMGTGGTKPGPGTGPKPNPGSGGGPKPPESKDKKKETIDTPALIGQMKAAIDAVIQKYVGVPIPEGKTAADMVPVIKGALLAALLPITSKYDIGKNVGAKVDTASGIVLNIISADKIDGNFDEIITQGWVEKYMKAAEKKEAIDGDALVLKLLNSIQGVMAEYTGKKYEKTITETANEIYGKMNAAMAAEAAKYDLTKLPKNFGGVNAACGVGFDVGPAGLTAKPGTKLEKWVTDNMTAGAEIVGETTADVEKQLDAYINKWLGKISELARTNGNTYYAMNSGKEVMNAMLPSFNGEKIPADLLAKIGKHPDIKAKYKPGNFFSSYDIPIANGSKTVAIAVKYEVNGQPWLMPMNERKQDYDADSVKK